VPRPGPVDRVRARLAGSADPQLVARLPGGYQRLGRVALVRWPEDLRALFGPGAEALAGELGVAAVFRVAGPVEGDWRLPRLERLFGTSGETEVREDGLRYRFDASRVLYSRGNRSERARWGRTVRAGERVVDLFAGIGYFALPAARHGRARTVLAVEEHPLSYGYLRANLALNRLEDRVTPVLGDNRSVALPARSADRVLLGFLPDALPWVPRALELLDPDGGWLHVHRLAGSREPPGASEGPVRERIEGLGARVRRIATRGIKSYGPGRDHVVVDVEVVGGPA
jgi:tRNA wybutosine-synthesizing protein 2